MTPRRILIPCRICGHPVCDRQTHISRRGQPLPDNPLYPQKCWWFVRLELLQTIYPKEDFKEDEFGFRSGPNMSQKDLDEFAQHLKP